MGEERIAEVLHRAREVFARRPGAAAHEDSPASARWQGGLQFLTAHPSGKSVVSDMPVELGGTGQEITPGWFSRAGTAACTATCIAMVAASRGLELTSLEVRASSRSDVRGVLGMEGEDGRPIDAAPSDLKLLVLIGAKNASRPELERLVEEAYRCSPSALALARANQITIQVTEV